MTKENEAVDQIAREQERMCEFLIQIYNGQGPGMFNADLWKQATQIGYIKRRDGTTRLTKKGDRHLREKGFSFSHEKGFSR